MSAEAPALLPCPFCGGEADLHKYEDESLWSHEIVGWAHVSCPDCDASGGSMCDDGDVTAVDQVVAHWNARARDIPGRMAASHWEPPDDNGVSTLHAGKLRARVRRVPNGPWLWWIDRSRRGHNLLELAHGRQQTRRDAKHVAEGVIAVLARPRGGGCPRAGGGR